MAENKSASWQGVRRQLNGWSKPVLIALVKEFYELSSDNRDFLQARFVAEENTGASLEKYRRKIVEQFFPSRGFGKLKLAEARKAIRDYRKATGNLEGTIDLMLTYVEKGTDFTNEFGDIDWPFYASLGSVLNEMVQLLIRDSRESFPRFRERIRKLDSRAGNIGWGYGDFVQGRISELEAELEQET